MQDRQLRLAGQQARARLRHQPLGECVERLVSGLDIKGMLRLGEYRRAFEDVVPDDLGPCTRVVGLRSRVLTVAVDGAAQRYLLQVSLRPTLLAAVNGLCKGRPLRDLRFVLADDGQDPPNAGLAGQHSRDADAL